MNMEVIKAMNKKEKKHTFRSWWRKNGHKITRIVLFPVVIILWLIIKFQTWLDKRAKMRNAWNEERANKILSYYIPRKADWCAEDKSFYFFDNGMGWGMAYNKKFIKFRDRRWWNYNRGSWGGKIRSYLIDEFELEGFKKEIGDCDDGWTEISFTMIKEHQQEEVD